MEIEWKRARHKQYPLDGLSEEDADATRRHNEERPMWLQKNPLFLFNACEDGVNGLRARVQGHDMSGVLSWSYRVDCYKNYSRLLVVNSHAGGNADSEEQAKRLAEADIRKVLLVMERTAALDSELRAKFGGPEKI